MRSGDVLWNPLTGEKAAIVESAEETGGARIVVDLVVEPGGSVPGGEHIHDHCSEHFAVRSGQITFLLDGRELTLGPGDEVEVKTGTWHRWWNPGGEEVRIRARVEPAIRFEEAILVFWGLCADPSSHPMPFSGSPSHCSPPWLGGAASTARSIATSTSRRIRRPKRSSAGCRTGSCNAPAGE